MKNALQYVFILLVAIVGCRHDSVDKRVDGCLGASFFYLDNQSSHTLWIAFTGPHLNNQRDSVTAILPQQRVLIGQDADFGYMPRPADTFSSITLFTLVAGQKSAIYTQAPVQTGLWQKRKQNQTDPDFGCYQVDYTLTITDAVLR